MTALVERSAADEALPVASARRLVELATAHPVLGAAIVALVIRLAFAVATFFAQPVWLIPDEAQYIDIARFVADGRGAEAWFPSYGQSLYDETWVFMAPIAFLFDILWPTRLLGQLVAVAGGVATVALTVRLSLELVPRRWALAAGLVVALVPSQVLWSSVVLRESLVWTALAGLAVIAAIATRSSGARLAVCGLGAVVLLLALNSLRDQTALIATWSIALTASAVSGPQRIARALGAVGIALLLPASVGLGVGGWSLVHDAAPRLGQTRAYLGLGAETSVSGAERLDEDDAPGVDNDLNGQSGAEGIAGRDNPTVETDEGRTGRVVRDADGTLYIAEEGIGANLSHIPEGVLATLFRPFVWEDVDGIGFAFARVENIAWYALYVLAAIGLVTSRRRWRVIAFPTIVTAGILGVAFVTQGNVGTAFRHRGQVLWAIAVLAAAGAAWCVERRTAVADR